MNPASSMNLSSSDVKQTESVKATLLFPGVAKPSPINGMFREGKRSKKCGSMSRASSNNVMLFGYLENVKGNCDVLDYLPKTVKELREEASANKKAAKKNEVVKKEQSVDKSQDQSERLDAKGLKEMGNKEYKSGRFAEAVALDERAIAKDANKASYWSNKAAALLGLGQLLEAGGDCRAAVRIDPSYCRAHYRVATLYLR